MIFTMPEGDLLKILLSHDRWASQQVLDACLPLTAEQFHQHFEIGPGSLHDALTHIIGAMRSWTETLMSLGPGPRLEDDAKPRTPEQLSRLLDEAHEAFAREAARLPLESRLTRRLRSGRTIELTRAEVLAQVLTHGMHHRAQCLNMLRQLNVHPLPPSSVTEWTWRGQASG
jgi:uncharacterized damage-inducible protein DinB